ncbi:hypothetical protein Tco_0502839 [Tanacetum coccineum]
MVIEHGLTEGNKRKGKAPVQFDAQSLLKKDWDTFRASLKANAELREESKVLLAEIVDGMKVHNQQKGKFERDKDDQANQEYWKAEKLVAWKGIHKILDKDDYED